MTMEYVGGGTFAHRSDTDPLPNYPEFEDIANWTATSVLDFNNGFVGIVETPWVTRPMGDDASGAVAGQFRVTVIRLTNPGVIVTQQIITLSQAGPGINFSPELSAVTLAPGRVLIVVNGDTSEYSAELAVVTFDGSVWAVGPWTVVQGASGSGSTAWFNLLMGSGGTLWLVGWNLGIWIAKVTVTGRSSVSVGQWKLVRDPDLGSLWNQRYETSFTMVNGVVRAFLWLKPASDPGAAYYSYHVATFRTDGSGWAQREIDPDTRGGASYQGGYTISVANKGDISQVEYYKYRTSGDTVRPDWEVPTDSAFLRVAKVWSTGQEVKHVRQLPPPIEDSPGPNITWRLWGSGEQAARGGSHSVIPHPIAFSSYGSMQYQVGLYGLQDIATAPLRTSAPYYPYPDTIVVVQRRYILVMSGGGWTDYDAPATESPTEVHVFHWTPEGDLAAGDARERGYFS